MGTRKKIDTNLSFRNFSPFYEKALAEAKREENMLRIVERDLDRRKMIAYSHLKAEQRLVEKDLYELRLARQRAKAEKARLGRRAMSDTNIMSCDQARLRRELHTSDEIERRLERKKGGCGLPSLLGSHNIVSSSNLERTGARNGVRSSNSIRQRRERFSLPSRDFVHIERSVDRSTVYEKTPGNPKAGHKMLASCTVSFTKANNAFDGQY